MPSIEDVILSELSGALRSQFATALEDAVAQIAGRIVVASVDVNAGIVSQGLADLDDHINRATIIESDPSFAPLIISGLRETKARLNTAIKRSGHGGQSWNYLEQKIATVLPTLLHTPFAVAKLTENPFPRAWRFAADEIAKGIHTRNASEFRDPEWLLLNCLLFADYFLRCHLPYAKQANAELEEACQSLLSVRGCFVTIPEKITESGITDEPPKVSSRTGPSRLAHVSLSDLLRTTAEESSQIESGNGAMHRILAKYRSTLPPKRSMGRATYGQLVRGRDSSYRQYEYTILTFMAFSCIEQLARSVAHRTGVPHVDQTGVPKPLVKWIAQLPLSPSLVEDIRHLFDSRQANIRNRVVHGGLVMIQAKRQQAALSIVDPVTFAPAREMGDPYVPENICQTTLECLEKLDSELVSIGSPTSADLSWAEDLWLTTDEIEVGHELHNELTSSSTAMEWRQHFSIYLKAVCPGLKTLFDLSYVGWLSRVPFADSRVLFFVHGIVFEAIYRITAHMIGVDVLQKSRKGNGTELRFQYQMLDDTGLCSQSTISRLLDHIDDSEPGLGEQVIRLAVKARNALAHGAIVAFDQHMNEGVGHIFFKATQALLGAGEHHLTRERAYYKWKELCCQHGFHEEDWRWAEEKTLRMLEETGGRK